MQRVGRDRFVELVRRDETIDKADGEGLSSVEPSRAEENVLGARRSDEFDETTRFREIVEKAELRRGDGEIDVLCAEAQIASQRNRQTTTDRIAAQGGDARPIERDQGVQSLLDRVDKFARRLLATIGGFEFRDVGAR